MTPIRLRPEAAVSPVKADRRRAVRAAIDRPIAVVVAHPDDETLGLGSRLPRFGRLKLIHLTDGAPRDMVDADRLGLADWRAYAELRRREARAALMALGAEPTDWLFYDYPDKATCHDLAAIARRLAADIASVRTVVTHAHEHGHPDHDSAAFCVHAACAMLRRMGARAPVVLEFASYHWRDGRVAFGAFWPDPGVREQTIRLTPAECARKSAALACFASQRSVIASFNVAIERLRPAPTYDFAIPAPPAAAVYDAWSWGISSRQWRDHARAALASLGLGGAM